MAKVQESIDVAVPVSTAYNQWTQFETFPKFMSGVESITQTSDTRTHWVTSIGGVRREFDAEITEQHPDERVAWKSTDGESHAGVVTFHRLDESTTRLMVQIDWHPETFTEKIGAVVNADAAQVKGDLKRFKEFIEKSGGESGAWRGDVSAPPSGVVGEAEPANGTLPDGALNDPDSGGPRMGTPGS
ncbi:putative membrane protein [Arthrobacter sp. CAN_A214]